MSNAANESTLKSLIRAHSRAIDELAGRHGATCAKVRAVISQHNRAIARLCEEASSAGAKVRG